MSQREASAQAGAIYVIATFAIGVLLYVGSFAFLVVDDLWNLNLVIERMNEPTLEVLRIVYWPLIQVLEAVT